MKESEDMRMDPRHSKAWYRGWHSFSMIKTCFTPVLTVWLLITKQYKTWVFAHQWQCDFPYAT